MSLLFEYSIRILPGLILLCSIYFLLPKNQTLFNLFLYTFGFILMRDAMIPLGLWEFGVNGTVIWLRFIESPFILLTLGAFSLFLSILLYINSGKLRDSIEWFSSSKTSALLLSPLMALVVVFPFILPYLSVPVADRGGTVPLHLLPALLIFALLGNFLEELLFRGFLQNYLEQQKVKKIKRILLSGLLFSMGHIFLALTVTDLGIMILLFTFWEGIICAIMHEKYGLVSATLTHGLAIFILSSGLI